MDRSVQGLLLCSHVFSIVAAPITPHNLIAQIIHFGNTFWAQNFLFKLLKIEDEDSAEVQESSTGRKVLKFSIKETTCFTSGNEDPANCEYKSDGVVMACVADMITNPNKNKITWQCRKENYRQMGENAVKDVKNGTQISEFSQDPGKLHKQQCLGCIFSLLPNHG
ncbi:15 kDa protein B-like [Dendrobates tinctorius]|uniref:15 kDa protein B-like n=1 Tax=Dendrobates tinctorius TaxID=92724 RepID=UPI003CC9571B